MIGFMDVSEMARMGGHARAKKMTKAERSESARKAINARWEKVRKKAAKKTAKKAK
jgi:hypothetical protein